MRYTIDGNGCWNWSKNVSVYGYGYLNKRPAHRVVYEALVGRIPAGCEIHHLCRNKRCVNPEHLKAIRTRLHRQTHNHKHDTCIWGHPFDEANTYVTKKGERQCRACKARRERERRIKAQRLA